jgi:hypothetical protein
LKRRAGDEPRKREMDWKDKLRREMYFYRGVSRCWHCRAHVHVYLTPEKKLMIFDENLEPHYASCKNPPARPHLARIIEFPRQKSLRFGD